jgi:hypothetical protein
VFLVLPAPVPFCLRSVPDPDRSRPWAIGRLDRPPPACDPARGPLLGRPQPASIRRPSSALTSFDPPPTRRTAAPPSRRGLPPTTICTRRLPDQKRRSCRTSAAAGHRHRRGQRRPPPPLGIGPRRPELAAPGPLAASCDLACANLAAVFLVSSQRVQFVL